MNPLELFISLLAPHNCMVCNKEGTLLCNACIYSVPSASTSFIKLSNKLVIHASADYSGFATDLVHKLKFDRTKAAAPAIALVMHQRAPPYKDVIVAHAPTASKRIRQRGYDQAALIARNFAKQRKLQYKSLLLRTTSTRQLGTNRKQRQYQLQNAFLAINQSCFTGRRILLVDDVITTGATLQHAAQTLIDNGAKDVICLAFAYKA